MQAHQFFASLPVELSLQIINAADTFDKPLYKELLAQLSKVRRTHPRVIERLPRSQRHPWIISMLSQLPASPLAFRCIVNWLLETQQPMLTQFLNALGVPHDGRGSVDEIPPEPEPAKIDAAIAHLLEKFPPLHVAIYLNAFHHISPDWATLAARLRDDPSLQITSQAQSPGTI